MSFAPINPRPFLQDLVNKDVLVRLKWGETEYKGRLVSIDSYMNVQLSNTEEYIDQKMTGALGQVLIRWVVSFAPAASSLTREPCQANDVSRYADAITCFGYAVPIAIRMGTRWRNNPDL
jgi:small nuclear ribonucleoprotein F